MAPVLDVNYNYHPCESTPHDFNTDLGGIASNVLGDVYCLDDWVRFVPLVDPWILVI
jgi:hypothetical protein